MKTKTILNKSKTLAALAIANRGSILSKSLLIGHFIIIMLLQTNTAHSQYVYYRLDEALDKLNKSGQAYDAFPSTNRDTAYIFYYKDEAQKQANKTKSYNEWEKTAYGYWKLDENMIINEEMIAFLNQDTVIDIKKLFDLSPQQIMYYSDSNEMITKGLFMKDQGLYYFVNTATMVRIYRINLDITVY